MGALRVPRLRHVNACVNAIMKGRKMSPLHDVRPANEVQMGGKQTAPDPLATAEGGGQTEPKPAPTAGPPTEPKPAPTAGGGGQTEPKPAPAESLGSEPDRMDKAVSDYALALGLGMLFLAMAALYQFQPEKPPDKHSSELTLHACSIVFCYMTLIHGVALVAYHSWNPGPSRWATQVKKVIAFSGIFWLVTALLSRCFLTMPEAYRTRVAVALPVCAAMSVLLCLIMYRCRDPNEADGDGRELTRSLLPRDANGSDTNRT